ncbi:hypothetical protein ACR78Z_12750 [Sphingobacterium thalpophilum]|uniref:alpha-L-rhamnosidase-related protein n=1 Tax=Sphingobacterium thalpophilum TaxID=259 RepID=UPI003DA6307A
MRRLFVLLLILGQCVHVSLAQSVPVNPRLLKGPWEAYWISHPETAVRDYGIYHFRKNFTLPQSPDRFIIHLSADNRYKLYVNGHYILAGPARGDLYNWYFDSIDLAPYLVAGENTLAVMVWNMGDLSPVAQVSNQLGLVLQADEEKNNLINSNSSWKTIKNKAYHPCSTDNSERMQTYMVVGPGDQLNALLYPWDWEKKDYDDKEWESAKQLFVAVPSGHGTDNLWNLVPRSIPLLETAQERVQHIRRISDNKLTNKIVNKDHPLVIPAHSKVSVLLDQGHLLVGYPSFMFSAGHKSTVKMTYAEALFKDGVKGNRNEIDGKDILGNYDIYEADGAPNRVFTPLWLRTLRYLQLDIETKDEPLTLHEIVMMREGYPLAEKASFESNDPALKDIWNVGWHTARLCAADLYYDCPYYEQLQYAGDSRIQSLISLYVSGDDRLMRKAIHDFYLSIVADGLPQGRYPSNRIQVIPTYGLYWVSMLYDYWMHRQDDVFLAKYLHAAQGVLAWYEQRLDKEKYLLGPMEWWNFTDWNTAFKNGVPAGAQDGNSTIISMHYAITLREAAAVLQYFGKTQAATHYLDIAGNIVKAAYTSSFNKDRALMADSPEQLEYSQHASILAILSDAVPIHEQKKLMLKILHDKSLSQVTFYYRFYLIRALKKVGMSDSYTEQLEPWKDMLALGLSTFAENPDPTRSDCHAWSSSPNYDFLATICGIMPSTSGFSTVDISPAFGHLTEIHGMMPHPLGTIKVNLTRQNNGKVLGEVELPDGLTGKFYWKGKSLQLNSGVQKISL